MDTEDRDNVVMPTNSISFDKCKSRHIITDRQRLREIKKCKQIQTLVARASQS